MVKLVDDIYIVKSFTTQDVSYQVLKSQSYLSSCSCLDQIHLCKHIFLVHRVEGVPYTARSSLSLAPPPAALPSNSEETENPRFEDFHFNINKYLNLLNIKAKNSTRQATDLEALDKILNACC